MVSSSENNSTENLLDYDTINFTTTTSNNDVISSSLISDCPIIAMFPFTSRDGRENKEEPAEMSFSHMAAALMAIDHFNSKDASVVPELAKDEFRDCDVFMPIQQGYTFVSVAHHITPAVDALMNAYAEIKNNERSSLCGIIGPYSNKAMEAASIFTASLEAPLISYYGGFNEIGKPQHFPMTAKIIADEDERASNLINYIQKRKYIVFLYWQSLTDRAEAMQNAIQVDSLEYYSLAVKPNPSVKEGMEQALEEIKSSGYKTIIIALARIRQWELFFKVAQEKNMTSSSNYVWVIYDNTNLDALSKVAAKSTAAANILNGAGAMRVLDGFQYNPQDDSFLKSWRSLSGNTTFIDRLNKINPIQNKTSASNGNKLQRQGNSNNIGNANNNGGSVGGGGGKGVSNGNGGGGGKGGGSRIEKVNGYIFATDDYFEANDPYPYSGFVYDSIIGLGMAKCRARARELTGNTKLPDAVVKFKGSNNYPYTGTLNLVFNELVNVSFTGATGEVNFNDGMQCNRLNKTMAYGFYNIRKKDKKKRDQFQFEYVLTSVRKPGEKDWTKIEDFIYADGTTNEPMPLRDVPEKEDDKTVLVAAAVVVSVLIIAVVVAYMFVIHKQKHADSVWIVKKQELEFGDEPEIIGMGTFGLVHLAEYRGTQVAVKRVIPARKAEQSTTSNKHRGTNSRLSSGGNISIERFSDESAGKKSGQLSSLLKASITTTTSSSKGDSSENFFSVSKATTSLNRKTYDRLKQDFIEEMRLLSKLRHPCITTVMGAVISSREEPMLVMEYMEHGSLHDLLHNDTLVFEGDILLPILRDISQGLRFLHAANPKVIHGDLKTKNILVDSKFRVKVADFGLSQKRQVGASGTPYWMAPELLRRESGNTPSSDVYAFGMILYETYSRKDPYEGEENPMDVLRLVSDPTVNKRPEVPSSCPPFVRSLMADCLEGQPENRPDFQEIDLRLKRLKVDTVEPMGKLIFSQQERKNQKFKETESLLFDVFPKHIAEALRDGRKVEPESRDVVTIFFSDIVGFTKISSSLSPIKISDMLDRLYSRFDQLSQKHDVFKVETIGDAYMAVTNLTKDQPNDHVKRIAEFSVNALQAAKETLIDVDDKHMGYVNIRIGFHSGPVVASVVGSRNPRYCLFGDTVNTASRMESNSVVDCIHCSERAAMLLQKQQQYSNSSSMHIKSRGIINIKGKGNMRTFWVQQQEKEDKLEDKIRKNSYEEYHQC